MHNLEQLADRLNELHEDLRAEVIVSDLLSGGLNPEDLLIQFTGQLRRPYAYDIREVKTARYKASRKYLLIRLNRDSLYDVLPEGIFHQPDRKNAETTALQMVAGYRRRKQEENEARLFFAPLENEIFYQKTLIESEEHRGLDDIHQSKLRPAVLDFLGLPPGLPELFSSRLVRLLPYASEVAGNLKRTEKVFSLLLEQQVSLSYAGVPEEAHAGACVRLGEQSLEADFILGDTLAHDHQAISIRIGPVEKDRLMDYLEGGSGLRCLQTLINFFVPVEWETAVHIQMQENDEAVFALNEHDTDGRVGYTTLLEEIA